MPRFAANLSLMYTELPFLARFAAAARDGFQAVEYLFPYAYPAEELAELLDKHRLQQVLFNAPPGGRNLQEMAQAWDAGMRGTLCLNGQEDSFRNGVWEALRYAQVLQCPRIHVMSGLIPNGAARYALRSRVLSNLRWAAQAAADVGVDIMIEPINHRDMPGYYLQTQDQAHSLAQTVAAPDLKVQMDLYHCPRSLKAMWPAELRQYLPRGAWAISRLPACRSAMSRMWGTELPLSVQRDRCAGLQRLGGFECPAPPRHQPRAGLDGYAAEPG